MKIRDIFNFHVNSYKIIRYSMKKIISFNKCDILQHR